MGEGVEGEVPHGVGVGEPLDHVVGQAGDDSRELLRRAGPRPVRMGEVGLPADVVHVELIEQLHADRVVDEATEDVPSEDVGRPGVRPEIVLGPSLVAIVNVLGAPEEVRDPADVALRQAEPQIGEAVPERRPQQVDQSEDRHGRRKRHAHARRRIGRSPVPAGRTSRRGSTAPSPHRMPPRTRGPSGQRRSRASSGLRGSR